MAARNPERILDPEENVGNEDGRSPMQMLVNMVESVAPGTGSTSTDSSLPAFIDAFEPVEGLRAETPATVKKNKFDFLKIILDITDKRLEPLERLNQATVRAKVSWRLKDVEGLTAVIVDDVFILANKFLQAKTLEAQQYAAAATLYAINAENVEIRSLNDRLELWRNDVGPKKCYVDYLKSVMDKAAKMLPSTGTALSQLEIGFKTSGVPLQYTAPQGTRWEQEISFGILNAQLASDVLRKGDCTKSKENEHKEALAASLILRLSTNDLQLDETETGFRLRKCS